MVDSTVVLAVVGIGHIAAVEAAVGAGDAMVPDTDYDSPQVVVPDMAACYEVANVNMAMELASAVELAYIQRLIVSSVIVFLSYHVIGFPLYKQLAGVLDT